MKVALHPEGVDRNFEGDGETEAEEVALHPEGVDRNNVCCAACSRVNLSPSTRRAWIEILYNDKSKSWLRSPSTRRAWIEMPRYHSKK